MQPINNVPVQWNHLPPRLPRHTPHELNMMRMILEEETVRREAWENAMGAFEKEWKKECEMRK